MKNKMTLDVKKRGITAENQVHEIDAQKIAEFASHAETELTKNQELPQEKTKTIKTAKSKKQSAIQRDTFSFPKEDHDLIQKLITKFARRGVVLNKSEVVRAGLHALNAMSVSDLKGASESVSKVKTGRPPQK